MTRTLQSVTFILTVFSSAPPCRPGPTQRCHTPKDSVYPRTIPSTPKSSNSIRTTLVICLNSIADVSWGRTERFRTRLPFLLMFEARVMAVHINRRSRGILGSQDGACERREIRMFRRTMQLLALEKTWLERLAWSSDHIATVPRVLFSTACFKRAESTDADNPAHQNFAGNMCRSKRFRLVSFYLLFVCTAAIHRVQPFRCRFSLKVHLNRVMSGRNLLNALSLARKPWRSLLRERGLD